MKRTRLEILLSLFILLYSLNAFGQEPAFKNYTTAEGLPSNNVYSVIQDDQGFIWFATDHGVSRFDGTRFRNFTIADGLSDNSVLRVAIDSKRRLWFLTFNGKLSFYKDGKFYNSSNSPLLKKIKFTNAISNFLEDSKKNIWISSLDRSAIRISPNDEVVTIHNFESRALLEDNKGIIHSVSSMGMFTFNNTHFAYKEIGFDVTGALSLPGDSTILLASLEGIVLYSINKETYTQVNVASDFKAVNLQGLFTDDKKNIWMAFINGVTEFDGGILSREHEHTYFNNYSITSVFNDRNGNLWFSSKGAGVFIVPSLDVRLFDSKSGLIENDISSLSTIGDDLTMVGTNNGSIQLIDHDSVKEKNHSIFNPTGTIIKIITDLHNNTWILTNATLIKYHNGIFSDLNSTSWNKSIFLSQDGTLWIGWGRGLRKVINDHIEEVFEDSIVNRFYAIEEINNKLYLGTDRGLFIYQNNKMIFAGAKDTILRHRINALAVTSDSTLWIATDGYGLQNINHGIITSYSTSNYLLGNNCTSLLADGNKIYIGTNKGLTVAQKLNGKLKTISYSSENGLTCGTINQIIKKAENIFLLATDNGIVEFNEKAFIRPGASQPYINEIIVNNVHIPASSNYNFRYFENNIQFEYGAINFNINTNTNFICKLKGIDSGWNHTTSTSVKYSDLKPGNYTFIVGIVDTDRGNPKTISITFFIQTPWWQTWWFRTITILILICIIAIIIKWQLDAYKKRLNARSAQAESELKALRSQINPHFIYNSLNSIQDFIMQNQKDDASLHLAKFARLMRNILSHSRKPKISLAEEIESLKLYLELESLRFSNKFSFHFDINELDTTEVYIPSMILQPYVENAILHGLSTKDEGGRIDIKFSIATDFLLCIIEDNGIGRKKSQELKVTKNRRKDESFGMKITEERIHLLSTQEKQKIMLTIDDLTDNNGQPYGTRVSIYFPLSIKYL